MDYTESEIMAVSSDLHQKRKLYLFLFTEVRITKRVYAETRRSRLDMIHGLAYAVILTDVVGNCGAHSDVGLSLPRNPKPPSSYIEWGQLPRSVVLLY